MTHLPPERLLALAERRARAADHPHVAACERCRAEVEALRGTLHAAAGVEVPEPSPLFWEHLSRRIGEAVRREPTPARVSWRSGWRLLVPLGAAAAVAAAMALSLWPAPPVPRPEASPAAVERPLPAGEALPVDIADEGGDQAWSVVAALAEGIDAETVDATGLAPVPGAVEEAARDLSIAERDELIRILRVETADVSGTEG